MPFPDSTVKGERFWTHADGRFAILQGTASDAEILLIIYKTVAPGVVDVVGQHLLPVDLLDTLARSIIAKAVELAEKGGGA
jgi:hypothetical protein